jgi:hypothetical protein
MQWSIMSDLRGCTLIQFGIEVQGYKLRFQV